MRLVLIIFLIIFCALSAETIWQDGFEENSGWILTGEFEIGEPQGLGGQYGNPDPNSAYAGLQVLGVDLSGLGYFPGDYENNLTAYEYSAISPVIDCGEFFNVNLSFMRWLNVEQPAYDHAYIHVSNDNGITWSEIWTNTSVIQDNSWIPAGFDISAHADMQSNLRLRFSIGPTDGSWQYCGWNIDNLVVTGDPVVYGAIEGNVINSANSEPVAFASVSCQFGNSLSDETGYFLLPHIPTGNHTINIYALGFLPLVADNILVTENDTTYVLCELLENPDTPPSPQNLTAEVFEENNVHLAWNEPTADDILLAYNIYRNGYLLASVLPEEYDDLNLVNGIYSYFVTAVYDTGESLPSNPAEIEINAAGNDEELTAPQVKLWNYPNPFNPSTTISFSLTTEITGLLRQLPDTPRQAENAELKIYNLKGQKVKVLTFPSRSLGMSEGVVVWDGTDEAGSPAAAGIYLIKLRAGDFEISRKCLLLK